MEKNTPTEDKPFWVTKKGGWIAIILLHFFAIASIFFEIIEPHSDEIHKSERIHELEFLASYSIYGFVACVILVFMGRILRKITMRNENYYEDPNP